MLENIFFSILEAKMTEVNQATRYEDLLKSTLSEIGLEDYYKIYPKTYPETDVFDMFDVVYFHGIRENKRFLGLPIGKTIAEIVSEANVPEEERRPSRLVYDRLQINIRDVLYLPLIQDIAKTLESELKQEVKVKLAYKFSKFGKKVI